MRSPLHCIALHCSALTEGEKKDMREGIAQQLQCHLPTSISLLLLNEGEKKDMREGLAQQLQYHLPTSISLLLQVLLYPR